MAKFGFDVSEVDVNDIPQGNYDPVPEGEYTLMALDSEGKETSTGGQMIKVKFEVADGEHKGRFIWQNFNTVNKSEVAQRIGRQQLVAWATSCGKPDCDDTFKLIGKKCRADVKIKPASGAYKAANEIRSFLFADAPAAAEKPKAAAKPAAAAKAAPAAAAATPAAAKAANPWD